MVVDDSAFFRKRLVAMIEKDGRIEVIAQAENGAQAVTLNSTRRPAVIVMDVNMPVMDGITAVREIMAKRPTAIMMFSALTHEGARESLDAIEAGALDFMPKNLESGTGSYDEMGRLLCDKLVALAANPTSRARPTVRARAVGRPTAAGSAGATAAPPSAVRRPAAAPAGPLSGTPSSAGTTSPAGAAAAVPRRATEGLVSVPPETRLVLIGSSTGGPVALQKVITALPANYPYPVVIAQHMPDRFTAEFAKRLDASSAVHVAEGADGDELKPGTVLICRGGMETELRRGGSVGRLALRKPNRGEIYQPSVDVLFRSGAELCADRILAVVLTGMGADGCEGARELCRRGAHLWAQDEATSVVYGMPQAVAKAGLVEHVLPLPQIGPSLAKFRGPH